MTKTVGRISLTPGYLQFGLPKLSNSRIMWENLPPIHFEAHIGEEPTPVEVEVEEQSQQEDDKWLVADRQEAGCKMVFYTSCAQVSCTCPQCSTWNEATFSGPKSMSSPWGVSMFVLKLYSPHPTLIKIMMRNSRPCADWGVGQIFWSLFKYMSYITLYKSRIRIPEATKTGYLEEWPHVDGISKSVQTEKTPFVLQ